MAVLILYLFPVLVALISHLRGTMFVNARQWLAILAMLAGLALLLWRDGPPPSAIGILCALLATCFTVGVVFTADHLTNRIGAATTNFYMVLWGLILLLLAAPVLTGWDAPQSPLGWLALSLNGSCYVVAWFAFMAGAQRIGIVRASVIGAIDPVLAALGGLLFFQERLTLPEAFGFAVVLCALTVFELNKSPAH